MSLIKALKLAYRKHVLYDDTIGWDELDNILHNALVNELGDEGFILWLDSLDKEEET